MEKEQFMRGLSERSSVFKPMFDTDDGCLCQRVRSRACAPSRSRPEHEMSQLRP